MAKAWGYKLHEWRERPQDERDLLLAHDSLVCSRCGNLRAVCSDRDIDWHPNLSVCWPTATAEWGHRVLAEKHKTDADSGGLRSTDGASIYPSLMAPEDDEFA